MTVTRRLGFAALGLGLTAAFAGSPYRHRAGQIDIGRAIDAIDDGSDHATALELAAWIRDRKPGLRVVDIRPAADFAAYAIPTAENIPLAALVRTAFQPHETVVLYSEQGAHAGQAWVLLRALGVFNAWFIAGGLADWRDDVLAPVLSPDASAEEKQAFAERSELSRYFGGQPTIGTRPCEVPASPTTGSRRRGC
jgi:rhodanese-related sulfurtransferase